jgi:hypothetical protein
VVLNGYLEGTLRANLNLELEADYPEVWVAERKVIRLIRQSAGAAAANP